MKIAYFLHTARATDGSSKAFLHLIHNLISKGIIPLVILPQKGEICPILHDMNIRYVILTWAARPSTYPWVNTFIGTILFIPRFFGRLLINSFATIQCIKILRQFSPDIIHSNSSTFAIGYYTASFLNIPHIWHIREYGAIDFNASYYPSFSIQQKRYKNKQSFTIGITKDILKYNQLYNYPTAKVIYDGVLPTDMQTYLPNKNSYFLYAGRLEKNKGILPLIESYAEYCKQHHSPLTLYIAGSGNDTYTQLVKDKITTYELEDKIKLLGVRKDILDLYKNARAFIVPSLAEGFGFITAEAMFSGCLVIGNNTAGTKEQFDNGKEITGEEIALRYNTQEQLVQHMIDVTNNSTDYYEPMILRAQQVVNQLYSTESHAENVYNFYNEILEKQ